LDAVIEVQNLTKTYTLSRRQKKEMDPQCTGDTLDPLTGTLGMGHLALVYASLLALAAANLVVCMFVIRSERVLFRT